MAFIFFCLTILNFANLDFLPDTCSLKHQRLVKVDGGPRVQIIQIIGGSVGIVQQAQLVLQSSLLCLLGSDQILHSLFGDQQMCFSKYLQSESETADFAPYPLNCAFCF